jgi:hypothetical protein
LSSWETLSLMGGFVSRIDGLQAFKSMSNSPAPESKCNSRELSNCHIIVVCMVIIHLGR